MYSIWTTVNLFFTDKTNYNSQQTKRTINASFAYAKGIVCKVHQTGKSINPSHSTLKLLTLFSRKNNYWHKKRVFILPKKGISTLVFIKYITQHCISKPLGLGRGIVMQHIFVGKRNEFKMYSRITRP